jgi:hypothetical protein
MVIGVFCFLMIIFLLVPAVTAQKWTHRVVQGDTLWDICEAYYGDSELWPKLWQMNSFITNPHLLEPGDVIFLYEREVLEQAPVRRLVEKKDTPPPKVEKREGIDLALLTDPSKLGFLSSTPIESQGKIFATKNHQIILDKGDTGYLIQKNAEINKGDIFLVGKTAGPLKDPISKEKMWYLFTVHGRVMIEDRVGLEFGQGNDLINKDDTYQIKVIHSFKPINVGDVIIPTEPIFDCVRPASFREPVLANIVETKERRQLIGKHDIVYINRGRNQFIERGHLFEIVKTNYHKNPSPRFRKFSKPNTMILPDISIGYCLVIDTRPDTSTAVVLTIKEAFVRGTYVKSRSWDDYGYLLSQIQTCRLD